MPPDVEQGVIPQRDVSVRLPPSFEGLLHSVDAVRRDLSNTTKDLRVMMEQQVQYAQRSSESMAEMRDLMQRSNETLESTLQAVLEDRRRVEEERRESDERREDMERRPPRSGGAPPWEPSAPAGPPRGPVTQGPGGEAMRSKAAMIREATEDIPLTPDQLQEQAKERAADASQKFRSARANPLRTIRQDMLTRVAANMSDRSASLAEGGIAARGLAKGAQALGVTAEQGMAKGLLSTMPVRLAGGVGLALGAVEGGTRFAESQRASNIVYQRALGGENVEGFGQRAREQLFQTGLMGTMGGGEAERLFQTVTGMGMSGNRRGNALDFAADAYKRFGMSIQDSTSLIETATRRGNESFQLLTDALEGVTSAARDSGVSAEAARQDFARTYEQTSQVAGGAGGVAAAEGLATLKASMGPGMQDIDFNQMFSEERLRIGANRMGMDYGQLISSLNTPQGVAAYLDQSTQGLQQMFGRQLPGGQEGFARMVGQRLESEMGENWSGNLAEVAPERWENLANQLSEEGVFDRMDPAQAAQLLQFQGIGGATPENFDEIITQLMSGAGPGDIVRQNQERMGMRRTTEEGLGLDEVMRQQVEEQGLNIIGDEGRRIPTEELQRGDLGVRMQRDLLKRQIFGDKPMDRERESLADDYINQVIRTGRFSGAIEKILSDPASSAGRRFRVTTESGEKRDVDLQKAVRYFSDQLASGEAVISAGEGAGQSVGDLYGFEERDVGDFGTARDADEEELAQMGLSLDEARQRRSEEQGGGGGTVVINPSPELARFLDIIPIEGNVEIGDARAGGVPPSSATGGM